MKLLDKLKIKVDKNLFLFLSVLVIVGIFSGSLFSVLLNNADKELINNHFNNFLEGIKDNIDYFLIFKNDLIPNLFNIIFIWLLGISIIGLPIIIFIFFSKIFSLGLIIGTIITNLKIKGLLFSLIYIFPGQVLYIIIYMIVMMYAMSFSIKLFHAIFYKKIIDFKLIINVYLKILLICLILLFLTCLYNVFGMTKLIQLFILHIL